MKKFILNAAMVLTGSFLMLSTVSGQTVGDAVAKLRKERIQASYLLGFGRLPSEGEIQYWQSRTDAVKVDDFINQHRKYIASNPSIQKEVIKKAYHDALGRDPVQGEYDYWSKGTDSYTMLIGKHIYWLTSNPAEYELVIKRSYQKVLGKAPSADEMKYWKSQPVYAYDVLISLHEDWKKRTGGTGQSTAGTTLSSASSYLQTVTVSADVLKEVKLSFNSLVAAGGGNMVAAGGGNMVAAGGGNLVAAGGGNMVAAGGGNVIGQNGAN